MQTYCASCKRNAGNKDPKAIKTKNGRLMLKSTFLLVDIKNLD